MYGVISFLVFMVSINSLVSYKKMINIYIAALQHKILFFNIIFVVVLSFVMIDYSELIECVTFNTYNLVVEL